MTFEELIKLLAFSLLKNPFILFLFILGIIGFIYENKKKTQKTQKTFTSRRTCKRNKKSNL